MAGDKGHVTLNKRKRIQKKEKKNTDKDIKKEEQQENKWQLIAQ